MKNKILAILLTIVMLLGMMPMSAFAADTTPSYVALGDSISTGYGLANKTAEGFTYLLAGTIDYELTNLAADGNTAAGILAQLQQQSFKDAVAGADLITVTAGGNDLMAVLYQAIADQYNATQSDTANHISASDITTIMADSSDGRRMSILNYAMGLLNPNSDIYLINNQAFDDAVADFISTLILVLNAIKALNADTTVIVATQYNPYVEYNGASFEFFMPIDLTPIYSGMEEGVTELNAAIKSNSATGGYLVADVKAAFDEQGGDLYVADPDTLEFDFHPNAAGHSVLADIFAEAMPSAPVPVAVSAVPSASQLGSVIGGGNFVMDDQVTLTAIPAEKNIQFYYWLDNSAELSSEPTEAQLKEAIVSYESTYTFTAEKDINLTAVFGYKPYVYLTRLAYETKDEYFADEEAELGIRLDEEDIRMEIGNAFVTIEKTAFAGTETLRNAYYNLDTLILAKYNETTGKMEYQTLESFAVPVAPVYNSVEYWNWIEQYEQHLAVAYLRHDHAHATRYDENGHWTVCDCGDKTDVQPHSFTENFTRCACGYIRKGLVGAPNVLVGVFDRYVKVEWKPLDKNPFDEISAKIAVLSGQKTVDATAKVDFRNENEVPSDDAEKIRSYANANFSGKSYGIEWMDISMTGDDGKRIPELDSPLAFGFDITGKKVLGVVSVHNGELIRFERLDNIFIQETENYTQNKILVNAAEVMLADANKVPVGILSMLYSTYAIIYEEEHIPDTPSSPQTGDNTNMAVWFALLLLSGGTVITLTVYHKRRRTATNR